MVDHERKQEGTDENFAILFIYPSLIRMKSNQNFLPY